ncbi:MAG TPA: hypothetical protein VGO08_04020 [Burkholderiales bacterium]|jgi:hypothetical protein|nr:hypothetical protein [Burkholderiales bacterium]
MTKARDELVEFVQLFWTAVSDAAKDSDSKAKTREYFDKLWYSRDKFSEGDTLPTDSRKTPTGTFSAARRALWLNRAALGKWLGPGHKPRDADDMIEFYEGRYISDRLNAFIAVGEYEAWWRKQGSRWHTIPTGSILINGMVEARVCLGSRTPQEIRAAIEAHPDAFANNRLRDPATPLGELVKLLNAKQRAILLQQRVDPTERTTSKDSVVLTLPGGSERSIALETVNWNERFEVLSDELGARAHSVLQTIAGLGMVNVPVSYAVLREMSGLAVQDFDQLMTRLKADRWITVPNPTTGSRDLDDRTVVLHPAAERAVRSSFRRSYPVGAILYGVLLDAEEADAMPPVMREQLLSHPLTVTLNETFERTPARRLGLLLDALPAHAEERAECAVSLAPYDSQRALAAIDEYLTAYPDADYLLPACLKASAEANQWEAFEAIWPVVAAQACARSEEIITHLTVESPPPLSRFAASFNDAVWRHPMGAQHISDLAQLCRTAFEDDDQCWTLWLGLPIMPPEFLETIDLSRLSPRLRACPWPSRSKE